jgi:phosphatidylglycerophosphate synthase
MDAIMQIYTIFRIIQVSMVLYFYYIHDKITAILRGTVIKRNAIISLIALSRSAINDFCDGWGSGKSKQQNLIWRRNLDKYF